MILSSFPVQVAQAKNPYTEKLNVFVAGSDAVWYFTFGGINGTASLSGLESTPGLTWYNITAINTGGWQSDYQVFGPRGYNLLPVPFVPPQGMFLALGSDSYTDASAAAIAIDSYLLTNFVSFANGTGTYTFYSPVSFSNLIPATLLEFLPTARQGFASAISNSTFASTPSPFVVLEGTKGTSGFSHALVVGSIASSALDSAGKPNVVSYFSSGASSIRASSASSSSVIQLRFLDGIVKSSDKNVTATSSSASFTGSYTLTLAPGKHVSKINATVVQQSAPILATRAVDVGVLRTKDNLSVTLTFQNLSPTLTISKLSFSDNWWSSSGDFKLLGGNATVSPTSLAPKKTITPVYRLQYTGTTSGSIEIPASVVRYQYQADGLTFNATAVINPIRLSLGKDDAVVYAILTPAGSLGQAVGATQKFNVTVFNVGTLPASSLVVAGQPIAGLAAKTGGLPGGSATVQVSQSAGGLTGINFTGSYATTFQDPSGTSLNATTNVVTNVFSHSSMRISDPILTVGVVFNTLSSQETNVKLSFSTSNLAQSNVTAFIAKASLPSGLGCGKVSGKGISCANNQVVLSYRVLNVSSTVLAYMSYNITTSDNYFVPSLAYEGISSHANISGRSNPIALPSGLMISKQFATSQLFPGMTTQVTVYAKNSGPLQFYNATLKTTADSFDTLTPSASLSKTANSISPGGNVTLSYQVSMSQSYGNLTGAPPTASFYLGGTLYTIQGASPKIEIFQPLFVTISTNPTTPEEGKNFTMSILITNPSAVPVSNVIFTLPVPSGLGLSSLQNAQVSGGTLSVSAGSLGPHASATAGVRAIASSGITVPFQNAKLTFTYAGSTLNGVVPKSSGIAIAEDVTMRYVLPTALVLLAVLFVAVYVRKKASSAPASRK
jgi:uncharacterized repeat protein (TIGR01451 family)